MDWIWSLFTADSVAHTVLLYSIAIAVGVAVGKIKVLGVSIGITGVLFAGIILAHFGFMVNHEMMEFAKDFGLILFVYSIGLQVGPGFFASLKKEGLSLNLLALSIILLGAGITIIIHYVGGVPISAAVGIMSGAVTNTPGLGAAQQALKELNTSNMIGEYVSPGLGYAVAYPFGVFGIILAMILVKFFYRIDIPREVEEHDKTRKKLTPAPIKLNFVVKNPAIIGKSIKEIGSAIKPNVVISRIMQNDKIFTPSPDTILNEGNVILVVGPKSELGKFKLFIGEESEINLMGEDSSLELKKIVVTHSQAAGRQLWQLNLRTRFNINITRINRAGIEFIAHSNSVLQFGDVLTVVGPEKDIEEVSKILGNSMKRLNEPNVIPIFIGIALGVLLGSIPIYIQGIPVALKLGLAGGPLIVAIIASRIGQVGKMSTYISSGANLIMRELGIVLFLASVGFAAGGNFWNTLVEGNGLWWMLYGAMITFIPLIIVSFIARFILKKNYMDILGLLSGSMTDPPALAFANSYANNDYPAVTYATVYPLTMFMRIMIAQFLILFLV